ncbi:MAG: T9SS type A sorting domain-containing protein [Bacteroidota bacterium]
MKNLIFFVAILTALSAKSQTNVYHPFPDSSAMWNIHYSYACMGGWSDQYYSVTISGDTVIGGVNYHKFTTPYIQSVASGCGGMSAGYRGAVRQDVTQRKVFIVPPATVTEQLLYDFTLAAGDTVKGYTETQAYPRDVVQSIDSVMVGSSYRKRWNLPCYDIHIIEGIGSTYGLFQFSPGCITDAPDFAISCFRQNGQTLYPDPTANCGLITSVNSPAAVDRKIRISPNPSHGSFTVEFEPGMKVTSFRLTDLPGRVLLRQYTDNRVQFTIRGIPRGIYLFTAITEDHQAITTRVIVSQ